MIFDSHTFKFERLKRCDVAIVGAGAVGIIAALDLCRRGLSVVLLDAGPSFIHADSQHFFDIAQSVGKKHLGIHEGRFRALGGTTNFWGGQLVRLDSIVFEERMWIDSLSGWPIGLNDIERYYRRCEDFLQIPETLRSDESVFDIAGVPDQRDSADIQYFLTRWLTEKNFRVRFNRELQELANLTVITNAPVVRLRMDPENKAAVGVRIRLQGGSTAEISCRTLVLANGTIEIARLLQHPLADDRSPAWSGNPWLAHGFMDHLEGTLGTIKPRQARTFRRLFDNIFVKGMKFQPRLRINRNAQIDRKLLNFAIHLKYDANHREHFDNAKIFFIGLLRGRFQGPAYRLPGHLLSAIRVGMPMMWHYMINGRIFVPNNGTIEMRIMVEQQQVWESRIVLTNDQDSLGMKIAALDWRVAGTKEMETVRAAAEMAKRHLESLDIADVQISPGVLDPAADWIGSAVDTFHHMGATRMASSDEHGVVDSNCRVFGTENLYVAGASVFPSAGFANPTFTAMALALRLCDHLAERIRND